MSVLEKDADVKVASQQLSEKTFLDSPCISIKSCQLTGNQCAVEHHPYQGLPFPYGNVDPGSRHQQGDVPHRFGKYMRPDGCIYEGQWKNGKTSGKGKISWPSGATYEGDFLSGFIHGFGTYTSGDGTTYTGSWFLNEKSGFGTKKYVNGDFYEGSWNKGLPDGEGMYIWKNGDTYIGEWISGAKSGRGVLVWACGDKYDGQWMHGIEHGHGVYTWKDGGIYTGTWSNGVRIGKGTFVPARFASALETHDLGKFKCLGSHNHPSISHPFHFDKDENDSHSQKLDSSWLSHGYLQGSESWTSSDSSLEDCLSSERSWSLDESLDRFVILDDDAYVLQRQDSVNEKSTLTKQGSPSSSIFERHHVEGTFFSEVVKETSVDSTSMPVSIQQKNCAGKTVRAGETIFRGHQSYELMLSLQLGIRYTIGKISLQWASDVSVADFGPKARVWMSFPKQGSQLTPPHQSIDFKWKDYCPAVFRHLRELLKIDTAEYMMSVCGKNGLRELSSPGKSGSVFYLSYDDRFLIKTVRKAEGKVLLGMLRNYYNHVRSNESTLIAKFYGLHRIKPAGGPKVRFVVMANMFCTDLSIHQRFDLKGSSQGRSAHKLEMDETTTLKDLDLNFVFRLQPSWREALLRQVEKDCMFLESERIMDYSLLLGLHFLTPRCLSERLPSGPKRIQYCDMNLRDKQGKNRISVTSQESEDPLGELTSTRLQMQLGVNMPAKADSKTACKGNSRVNVGQREAHDVVLYFGIIDILQEYDIGKKLERAYKSLQHDPLSISAVDPKLYSRRFQNLIERAFQGSASS